MEKTASLAALFLVLYVSHDALGQETAHEGDQSVSLPFIMNLNLDSLSDPNVQWIRAISEIVHLRAKDGDQLQRQSSVFRGRTRMNPDSFQTGNLTLVLSKPTVNDTGSYTCVVRDGPTDKGTTTVALSVTVPPPPADHTRKIVGGTVGVVAGVLLTVVTLALIRKKRTKGSFRESLAEVFDSKPNSPSNSVL